MKDTALYLLIVLGCFGCMKVTEGIPAKEYQQSAPIEAKALRSPEMLQQLADMSKATNNQTFTEEFGFPAYILGPGDLIEFTFWNGITPEKYETRVRPDGTISYSFLDDVKVVGLTARQVDKKLTKLLTKYIKEVRLDVVVSEHKSKSALLFGEINVLQTGKSGPGRYTLQGKTAILDFIVGAGGTTKDSDLKRIELVRNGRSYSLSLYDIMFKGDISQNVIIDNGDVVTVPELPELGERVYVFGEVKTQGVYPHEGTQDLLAAIGRAGGVRSTAIKEDVKIIRGYGSGAPVVISVNFDAILKQGDIRQNIPLLNGDVVYVPQNLIGDINEFIANTTPMLNYLFFPERYRNAY